MGRWAPAELIAAAAAGDADAAGRLISRVWSACFRLAASLTGDRSLAQDVAQETCVIIHQKIAGLHRPEAFDTWLYRIVVRESARIRRRRENLASIAYADGFRADDTARIDVWRALGSLPPVLRDVTVLFYFDDLKTEEIAAILTIPHPTVRTRLARARVRLRAVLGDYSDAPAIETRKAGNHVG